MISSIKTIIYFCISQLVNLFKFIAILSSIELPNLFNNIRLEGIISLPLEVCNKERFVPNWRCCCKNIPKCNEKLFFFSFFFLATASKGMK